MVDILWDHLVLLQQDVDRDAAALKIVPSNLCKTLTDPVSMPRLPPSLIVGPGIAAPCLCVSSVLSSQHIFG